ncbi:hypothetical protein [Bergeyella zoohelcum]|uniref:Uncharacterized protein n=1 Tax=Bergeyella zoohelcum TaxID=1015 RepID=A0A7Z9CFD3_9FLAO|nr:hypothetical protein [Bergeyella zoohelcum]VDH03213.1 Uncharacterised protein [Bergeyella zoohelcum]
MKQLIKLFSFLGIVFCTHGMAQTIENVGIKDASVLVAHKQDFLGKPLSYLLSKIDKSTIKSVSYGPNRNREEVHMISFRYLSYKDYQKTMDKKYYDRPTRLVVIFNQNWDLSKGKPCYIKEDSTCVKWTGKDEKNLGGLVVHDIYVLGRN